MEYQQLLCSSGLPPKSGEAQNLSGLGIMNGRLGGHKSHPCCRQDTMQRQSIIKIASELTIVVSPGSLTMGFTPIAWKYNAHLSESRLPVSRQGLTLLPAGFACKHYDMFLNDFNKLKILFQFSMQ